MFIKRGSYGNIVTDLHFFPQYPCNLQYFTADLR